MNESVPEMDRGIDRKMQIPFFIWKIGTLFLGGLIVMLLWNAIITDLFSLKQITYLQSVGLLFLVRILTGNFRRVNSFGGRGRFGGPPPHIIAKWKTMSPEERQKFKEEWRARCSMRGRQR